MKSEERSCTHKIQYTRADAQNIVEQVRGQARRTRNDKHRALHAYHCQWCDHWHVGHEAPTERSRYKRLTRHAILELFGL